jgi:hypothetical protein
MGDISKLREYLRIILDFFAKVIIGPTSGACLKPSKEIIISI